MIANVREVTGNRVTDYTFQIIVAGYDNDGKPKIGRMAFGMHRDQGSLISDVEDIHITLAKEDLVSEFNGISDLAKWILKHPESKPEDAMIRRYATSLTENAGRTLTTEEMVELAKRLAYYTSQVYREVGGINQVAVIQKPGSVSIEQPSFPAPPKPISQFALMVGGHFAGMHSVTFGSDVAHVIAIRCSWNDVERQIDGNYYIGDEFTNSLLTYGGGTVELGDTNTITNSALVLQPLIDPNSENVKRLERAFRWSAILLRFGNGQTMLYQVNP